MELSETPTWDELNQLFGARRRPTYDESVRLSERIGAYIVRDDRLYPVRITSPGSEVLTYLDPSGDAVTLRVVAEFYTFHTVDWAHTIFRPTLVEIFASLPPELAANPEVCGVSVRKIYGTTDFGSDSWHVGIATAYARS